MSEILGAESLLEIAHELHNTITQDGVLDAMLATLSRIVPDTAANIMLLEGDMVRVVRASGYDAFGSDRVLVGNRWPMSDLPAVRDIAATQTPQFIANGSAYPGWFASAARDPQSYMGVPLVIGEKVAGLINLDAHDAAALTEEHIAPLQLFASHAASALRNAQHYEGMLVRNRELLLLSDMTGALISSPDLHQILRAIVREIGNGLDVDYCTISTWSEEEDFVTTLAEYRRAIWRDNLGLAMALEDYPQKTRLLRTGTPFSISLGVPGDDPSEQAALKLTNSQHVLSVPLRQDKQIRGLLEAYYDTSRPLFTQKEIDAIQEIAQSVAQHLLSAPYTHEDAVNKVFAAAELVLQTASADWLVVRHWERVSNHVRQTLEYGHFTGGAVIDRPLETVRLSEHVMYQRVLTKPQSQIVRLDADYLSAQDVALLEQWNVQAVLMMPLVAADEVVGMLELATTSPDFNFSPHMINLATTFATQSAVAIENARLFKSEREQRTLAEALAKTAAALNRSLDLDTVLDRILDTLVMVFGHEIANVMMIDHGVAQLVRSRGYDFLGLDAVAEAYLFVVDNTANLKYMKETGQPLAIADTDEYPGWIKTDMSAWVRSIVCAPIKIKDEVVGFLSLDSGIKGYFTKTHAARLQTLADIAAPAIENAQLYQRVLRRNQYISTLRRVSRRSVPERDPQQFMQAVVDGLVEEFDYPLAYIALLDNEKNLLRMGAASGHGESVLELDPTYAQPMNLGIVGQVATTGEPYLARNTKNDPHYIVPPGAKALGTQLSVPIRQYEKAFAVLTVEAEEPGSLDDLDLEIMQEMADELAILLENVYLNQQTERHAVELEQHIIDRTAELVQRNKELDAFAHTVAHDLKSPLHLVIGFADVLLEGLDDLKIEDAKDYLTYVLESALKMANIIDELLLLAGALQQDAPLTVLDMKSIVNEAMDRLLFAIREAEATINHPEVWPSAIGYSPWVEQIWINYMTNAIKYGGKPPMIQLGYDEAPPGFVTFWIQDNGPGLSPEEQKTLFTPFTQLQHDGEHTGHGLGLSIVQQIVEKLGGTVGIESRKGKGSRFTFTLPAVN